MNLILLQLKRDVKASAGLLALWFGLLLLYVFSAASSLHQSIENPNSLGLLVLTIAWCVAAFLAARWILLDPPADETAFWRARPLRWPHMLAAKALLILVFLVVPLLLTYTCVLLTSGGGDWWPATLADMARTQLWWIAGAAALAAVGGSWRRTVTIGLVLWIGSIVVLLLLDGLAVVGIAPRLFDFNEAPLAAETMIENGWELTIAVFALVLQYAFQRTKWTALVVIVLAAIGFSFSLSQSRIPPPSAPSNPAELPEFEVRILNDRPNWYQNERRELIGISATVDIGLIEPPYYIQAWWMSQSHVRYPGQTVPTAGRIEDTQTLFNSTYQVAVPGFTLLNPNPDPWKVSLRPHARLADFEGMKVTTMQKELLGEPKLIYESPEPREFVGRDGIFEGKVNFQIHRQDVLAELPLKAGSIWSEGPNSVAIVRAGHTRDNLTAIRVRVQWIKLSRARSLPSVEFMLINRDRLEAYAPRRSQDWLSRPTYPYECEDRTVFYHQWGSDYMSKGPIDEDWLAGASVLVITNSEVGQVAKDLRLKGFRLWPDPEDMPQ